MSSCSTFHYILQVFNMLIWQQKTYILKIHIGHNNVPEIVKEWSKFTRVCTECVQEGVRM